MGIDSEWKEILEKCFGHCCHLHELPKPIKIDLVIDDMSLNLRRIFDLHSPIKKWDEIGQRLRTRVQSLRTSDLKRYVITFDERKYVPLSKKPRQEERVAKSMKKTTPFTQEEIDGIRIEKDVVLGEPQNEFFEKIMLNRSLQQLLYRFASEELVDIILPTSSSEQIDLIIDGGIIRKAENDYKEEEQGYVYISTRRNENEKEFVHVKKSEKIGEGDLKIPKNIAKMPNGNIYIRSNDGDMIPILLLNMRRWIDKNSKFIKYGIFIDTRSRANQEKGCIVDVVSLWRNILVYFKEYFPGIHCPIETICLLILLTGSDYTERFPQLGPATVWKSFLEGGHKILFKTSQSRVIYDNERKENEAILMDDSFGGMCHQRYSLTIKEHNVFEFLTFCYHKRILMGNQKKRKQNQYTSPSMERNRIFANFIIPSDEEIISEIRRVWWTLDYWMNGISDSKEPFTDPIELHKTSGLSKRGWEYDNQRVVKRAKHVHHYLSCKNINNKN